MNVITLVGRLTADPEIRNVGNDKAVCQFTLAVDRPGKDAGTDFINIVVWNKLGELCSQYLRKGRLAALSGRLQLRNYEKDGRKVYVSEVVADNVRFLEKADSAPSGQSNTPLNYGNPIDESDLLF